MCQQEFADGILGVRINAETGRVRRHERHASQSDKRLADRPYDEVVNLGVIPDNLSGLLEGLTIQLVRRSFAR